jgi:GNAT superfamily N-acetyltransferase
VVDTLPQRLEGDLEWRVLAYWAGRLGVDPDALDRDGLVVLVDGRELAVGRRTTIRTARGTLLLADPAEVATAAADPAAYVADVEARARGVGLIHYGGTTGADPRVRVLGAADRLLLEELQRAAGDDATEEADVDVEHPLAVGIVDGGSLLAIASLLDEGDTAVDVGVLVAPAARGRGLGTAVVADVTRRAAEDGGLVQYRCNLDNEASQRLARACGFELWGVFTVARQT